MLILDIAAGIVLAVAVIAFVRSTAFAVIVGLLGLAVLVCVMPPAIGVLLAVIAGLWVLNDWSRRRAANPIESLHRIGRLNR